MNYKAETLFDPAEVKKPSAGLCPIYSWVWNSPITEKLIIEQIDRMEKTGIRAMYIIPEPPEFRPTYMVTYMTPKYLSDEFFDLVRFAVNYAKAKDMLVWLYDEGGWPSGAACGKVVEECPDCCSEIIVENEAKIKKGEVYRASKNSLCAFTNDLERITDGYTADDDCTIYEYCIKKQNMHLPCLLKKEAVDTFIDLTYEGYKNALGEQFGKDCPVIFTDEAILNYPYTILNTDDFKAKTGFDFYEYLPAVFHSEAFGIEGEKFRIAYIDYSGRAFANSYMRRISEWCEENNVMLAGHMDGDHILSDYTRNVGNILKQLRHMDIPGVDVIWNQIYPGSGKNLLFPRMASSAANMTGKYYALSESFAVYGCGLTYDTMRYVINAQAVRGINIINIMSMSSGTEGFICHQFRPNFLLESPITKFLKSFNEYTARISYMCSVGKPCRTVAVYLPLRDIWAQHRESERVQEDFYALCEQLDKKYVDFDIIDDEFINGADLKSGKLCAGFAEYSAVYVPFCKYMPKDTAKKLSEFKESGGIVVSERYSEFFVDSLIEADDSLKQLRVSKRVTSDGDSVYMIFNEGTACFSGNIEIKYENKLNVFLLNLYDGELYHSNRKTNLVLESGEACFFLCTDKDYPAKTKNPKSIVSVQEMSEFNATVVEQFEIDNLIPRLVKKDVSLGKVDFAACCREDFSGGVRYECDFELSVNHNDLLIDLGKIKYCCIVEVNGREVGSLFAPPFLAEIPLEALSEGKNYLSVTIYNTAANVYASTDFDDVPLEVRGPYHGRTLEFEKQAARRRAL